MKSFLIVFLAVFPTILFAQTNYHAGFVLKNNGDTLKGFIDYREWGYSPLSIEFKSNKANAEVLEFTPSTIKGFQVTGFETYLSYSGAISMNRTNIADLPDGLDTSKKQDDVFLQQLETGKNITLYLNNDARKTRFFVAESNRAPVELKYYRYFVDSRSTETVDDLYKGQFILYIAKFNGGDKKLLEKAQGLRFEQNDLEELVAAINVSANAQTRDTATNIVRKGPGMRFIAGAGLGVTHSSSYGLGSNSALPEFNVGIDMFTNPNIQQLVFRFEVGISFVNAQFNDPSDNFSSSFSQTNISLTPEVLFNVYNTNNFKAYISAGESFNFSSSYWAGVPLQIGIIIRRQIELYLKYIRDKNDSSSIINYTTSAGVKFLF